MPLRQARSALLLALATFVGIGCRTSGSGSRAKDGLSDQERLAAAVSHIDPTPIDLGTFQVLSSQLVISDPCYRLQDSSLQARIDPVKRGEWKARVVRIDTGSFGRRNRELLGYHATAQDLLADGWEEGGDIGVDCGQAGIFEPKHYQDEALVPEGYAWKDGPLVPDQLWYSLCSEKTLHDPGAGVIPFGAVSRSGLGDGFYAWSFRRDRAGEVVGVKIVFLPE